MMLEIEKLSVCYGRVQAVRDASVVVGEGELIALIGANGAGKTTMLNTIMGLLKPARGAIRYRGQAIGGLASHRIVDLGLALVPEGRQLFPHMTVLENLEVSFTHAMRARREPARFNERLDRTCGYFPRIAERLNQSAGTLSGGEQQMLAVGRALMSNPKLLLLDEPSLGLAPIMVETIVAIVERLHQEGLGILLVEQNAQLALEISDRAYVLETGATTLSGASRALLEDARVRQAYLGF